jgi:hypothetical protein
MILVGFITGCVLGYKTQDNGAAAALLEDCLSA